jgi:hypothetical protein
MWALPLCRLLETNTDIPIQGPYEKQIPMSPFGVFRRGKNVQELFRHRDAT